MTLIPELDRELTAAITRDHAGRAPRRRWLRASLLVAVTVTAGSTAALAAVGVIPVGSPATDHAKGHRTPDRGFGVLEPGTSKVLAIEAEDPAGGPPWGLRISATSRGLGCLQTGRLVGNRIGVLGIARAFQDDGRFHPFAAASVGAFGGAGGGCAPLDANGRTFVSFSLVGTNASGQGDSCLNARYTRGAPASELCPDAALRDVYGGLLGPAAESVTYTLPGGGSRTVKTVGPYGAYLIVLRYPGRGIGGSTSLVPLNTSITQLAFTDGTSCEITHAGSPAGKRCVPPGYRPRVPRIPTRAEAAVRVRTSAKRVRSGRYDLTVRVRVRHPVPDAGSHYEIFMRRVGARTSSGNFTDRNLERGDVVAFRFQQLKGGGLYRGRVRYVQGAPPFAAGGRRHVLEVGTFTARTP